MRLFGPGGGELPNPWEYASPRIYRDLFLGAEPGSGTRYSRIMLPGMGSLDLFLPPSLLLRRDPGKVSVTLTVDGRAAPVDASGPVDTLDGPLFDALSDPQTWQDGVSLIRRLHRNLTDTGATWWNRAVDRHAQETVDMCHAEGDVLRLGTAGAGQFGDMVSSVRTVGGGTGCIRGQGLVEAHPFTWTDEQIIAMITGDTGPHWHALTAGSRPL